MIFERFEVNEQEYLRCTTDEVRVLGRVVRDDDGLLDFDELRIRRRGGGPVSASLMRAVPVTAMRSWLRTGDWVSGAGQAARVTI